MRTRWCQQERASMQWPKPSNMYVSHAAVMMLDWRYSVQALPYVSPRENPSYWSQTRPVGRWMGGWDPLPFSPDHDARLKAED